MSTMQVLVYICKKNVRSRQDEINLKNSGTNQSIKMDWIS